MIDRRMLLAAPFALMARPARATVPIVASFTIVADLVAQVGGSGVSVVSLVGPGGDAHTFQPRPSDVGRMSAAAVVVESGLGLEPWLGRVVRASGFQGRLVTATAGIVPRTFVEQGRAAVDPHAWQDPRLAARMVATIGAGLASADAAGAAGYRARAGALAAEIMAEDAAIERAFAAVPAARRQVITSHDAFGYYGARFGIVFRAAQGLSTAAEPTPRDLARLSAQIRREGIRVVFVESMTDPRIAAALAREAGAVVGAAVYSDSLSAPDGPAASYLAMLRHNTALFLEAMSRA